MAKQKQPRKQDKEWFLFIPQSWSFDNGTNDRLASDVATDSIEAIMDTNLDDGFKAKIKQISIHIFATSASGFWIKPVLVDTASVISQAIDQDDRSQENFLNGHIAGSFGRTNLSPWPIYSRAVSDTFHKLEYVVQVPQKEIDVINSRLEETDPAEECSLVLQVWIQTAANTVYCVTQTCIRYTLELNQVGR